MDSTLGRMESLAGIDALAGGSPEMSYPLRVVIPGSAIQSRLSASLRWLLAVPVVVFSFLLNVGAMLATWGAALVTGHVPKPLFDFQLFVLRWHLRASCFALLLADAYPVFDGDHPVDCVLNRPERISRWQVAVWKTILLIPHALALLVMSLAAMPVAVASWLVVVVTGRMPHSCNAYLAGLLAWYCRAGSYLMSLTDVFPPFSLSLQPRRARKSTHIISAAIGLVPVGLMTTFAVFIIGFSGQHLTVAVPYRTTAAGEAAAAPAFVESGPMTLETIRDPADGLLELFQPDPGLRYVAYTIAIENWRGAGESVPVEPGSFYLEDAWGAHHPATLIGIDEQPGAGVIESGASGRAVVVFALPVSVVPARLVWDVLDYIAFPRRGETIEWVFD